MNFMTLALDSLSAAQRDLLTQWLPGLQVEADHSWGLVGTTVLEVTQAGERLIVKAGGPADHHIARELAAHRAHLAPWTSIGRAPLLRHADLAEKILVTEYLPGRLVLGDPAADATETYVQAGDLLRRLHAQGGPVDPDYAHRLRDHARRWLDGPHRIPPDTEERLRAELDRWVPEPAALVPTHGDWQPRNWLIHDGLVSVIDFGRADLRPAMSDLARLAAQDFRRDPRLEAAFFEGYGPDPREPHAWHRLCLSEAIGTAAWAYQVGDESFEAQGHRMIDDALAAAPD